MGEITDFANRAEPLLSDTRRDLDQQVAVNVQQNENIETLRAALEAMLKMYVELVDSGDCGFWDAEKVPEVIAARAALSH